MIRLIGKSTEHTKANGTSRAFTQGDKHARNLVDEFIARFEEVQAICSNTGELVRNGELVASTVFVSEYEDGNHVVTTTTTKGPLYSACVSF